MSSEDDKKKDKLSDLFGMTPNVPAVSESKTITVMASIEETDQNKINSDYDFARGNMRDLIAIGMQVASDAAAVASQSGDANSFVSVAQIIKAISDTNKNLMGLSKQKSEVVGLPVTEASQTVTNNNLFVGTTADLQKFLDAARKKE